MQSIEQSARVVAKVTYSSTRSTASKFVLAAAKPVFAAAKPVFAVAKPVFAAAKPVLVAAQSVRAAARPVLAAAAIALLVAGLPSAVRAQSSCPTTGFEFSLLGGMEALNKNDTAMADHLVNIPVTAGVAYRFSPIFAAEGDFTWMIPVKQEIDLGSGTTRKAKSPNVLSYSANLRASLPVGNTPCRPYATAGLGAVTFLSDDNEGRMPRVSESETAFAINFGAGATRNLVGSWGLRLDFREMAIFPSKDSSGLATNGTADPIWTERAVVGLAYRF